MTEQPINSGSRRVSTSDDIEVGTYLEIAQADRTTGSTPPVDDRMQTIVIMDFGSQYSRLIARRIRELNTYCEILPHDAGSEILDTQDVIGIILSGGPNSVYESGAPMAPSWVYEAGVPQKAAKLSPRLKTEIKRAMDKAEEEEKKKKKAAKKKK